MDRREEELNALLARYVGRLLTADTRRAMMADITVWAQAWRVPVPFFYLVDENTIQVQFPRYMHDCDQCTFLGYFTDTDDECDLYFCTKGPGPTVLARFGSDGPAYRSGLLLAAAGDEALREAALRAAPFRATTATPASAD